ncbi:hypothetical protein EMPS_08706 [Entomortierella parvispora]|uniref:Uncharacterized protein n=1 Tax=Entomortierella parvispora TaxID=205924 RepID=A0A9P3HGT3_9FUNG|nr:hypothetical protein EMPS_08706 [Entomortierella parvispora]
MTLRSSDSISADRSPAASTSSMESSVPDMRLEGEIPGHLKNTPEVFVATDREKWLMESTRFFPPQAWLKVSACVQQEIFTGSDNHFM